MQKPRRNGSTPGLVSRGRGGALYRQAQLCKFLHGRLVTQHIKEERAVGGVNEKCGICGDSVRADNDHMLLQCRAQEIVQARRQWIARVQQCWEAAVLPKQFKAQARAIWAMSKCGVMVGYETPAAYQIQQEESPRRQAEAESPVAAIGAGAKQAALEVGGAGEDNNGGEADEEDSNEPWQEDKGVEEQKGESSDAGRADEHKGEPGGEDPDITQLELFHISEDEDVESRPEEAKEEWDDSANDELLRKAEEERELRVVQAHLRAVLRMGLAGGGEMEEEQAVVAGRGGVIFGTPLRQAWRGTWGEGWANAAFEEQAGGGGVTNMSRILQALSGVIAVIREEWRPLWAAHNQLTHTKKDSIRRTGSYWRTWRTAARRVKAMEKSLRKRGHIIDPRVDQEIRGEGAGESGEVERWARTSRIPTVVRPGSLEELLGVHGGREVMVVAPPSKTGHRGGGGRQLSLRDMLTKELPTRTPSGRATPDQEANGGVGGREKITSPPRHNY